MHRYLKIAGLIAGSLVAMGGAVNAYFAYKRIMREAELAQREPRAEAAYNEVAGRIAAIEEALRRSEEDTRKLQSYVDSSHGWQEGWTKAFEDSVRRDIAELRAGIKKKPSPPFAVTYALPQPPVKPARVETMVIQRGAAREGLPKWEELPVQSKTAD